METIKRALERKIVERFGDGKAAIIFGPRQVGKTTLLNTLFAGKSDVMRLSGDDPDTAALLSAGTATRFSRIFSGKRFVVIDEAQRIPDIGLKMKLIIDNLKNIQVVVTGSSSFELANHVNEPLTGRKWEYRMFPLSFAEMAAQNGFIEEQRLLNERLVYGYYPEVVTHPEQQKELLLSLTNSYLYKDIFTFEQVKNPIK
jgi:predicted AAA+ superfamily ATPase